MVATRATKDVDAAEGTADSQPAHDSRQGYNDLVASLVANAWLIVPYAVAFVALIYALGTWWPESPYIFLAAESATLLGAGFVLRPDPHLLRRTMILWPTCALLVWTSSSPAGIVQTATVGEVQVMCLWVLIVYGLMLALKYGGSYANTIGLTSSGMARLAGVLAVWGATLQVVVLALISVQSFISLDVSQGVSGRTLVSVLESLSATSPFKWAPIGFFGIGVLFAAASRLASDPYRPKNYDDILIWRGSPWLGYPISVVRAPTWLILVISEFVLHYMKQVYRTFQRFVDMWTGRMMLLTIAFAAPIAVLVVAHVLMLNGSVAVARYISNAGTDSDGSLLLLTWIHVQFVLGLCFLAAASFFSCVRIAPVQIRQFMSHFAQQVGQRGKPAFNAVGRAFSLAGMVVIAMPVANLLPGGMSFGFLSKTYAALLGVCLLIAMKSRQADHTE